MRRHVQDGGGEGTSARRSAGRAPAPGDGGAAEPFTELATRNFVTLMLGHLGGSGIAFIASIYIARILGAAAYGVVGFAAAVLMYFSAVTDGGIESLGPRDIAEDARRIETLAPSVLLTRLIVAMVLASAVAAVGRWLLPQPDGTVLAVFALTLLLTATSTRWIYLGLERPGMVAAGRIISEAVKLLLVVLLIHHPEDVARVPLAIFAGGACAGGIMLLWLRPYGLFRRPRFNLRLARAMFGRARPLMFTIVLGLVIYNSDLILLWLFRTRPEVGYYLAAYTLINALGLLGSTARSTLLPTLARLMGTPAQRDLYHSAAARLLAIGLPLALGGCLLAPQLIGFAFGAAYGASAVLLRILIWSVPAMLLRSVLQSLLIASGHQDRVLRMAAAATVVSLGLNLVLIPLYGPWGAAVTTVVAEATRALCGQYYVRAEGFPLTAATRFWRTLVATSAMGVALLLVAPASLWLNLAVGAVGYGTVLFLVGGIRFRRGALPLLQV